MNSREILFHQPIIIALGWTLLNFLWQGALIGLLLGAANVLLRTATASLRYLAACVAMLLMVVSGITTFVWLSFSSADAAAPPGAVESAIHATVTLTAVAARVVSSDSSFRVKQWFDTHLAWLVSLWFIGVVMLSMRTAGGWRFAQALKHRGNRPADPCWQRTLARLASRLGVRRNPALQESTLARVPAVIGWLRPVILLPVSVLAGLTPQMMEAILAHELAHIRRHDYLLNMLQTAIETLLFYHPAVWWVGRKIRQERENCCDDLAVTACGDALIYARALTALEQIRCASPQLAMAATDGSLYARIRRLLGVSQPVAGPPYLWLAGVLALVTMGSLWAGRPSAIAEPVQIAQTAPSKTATHEVEAQAASAPSAEPDAKDFIGGLAAAGYRNLSVDELITFKIHGVTPEFIREMEAAGFPHPTADELMTMRIQNVDSEFVKELKAAGYSGLSIDQLVAFKIHGVDPARLAEMQKLWGKLSPDQVITMQIHEMTPEYAAQMKGLGMGEPSFDQLVSMKIHDVTPEFARELKALGVGGLSLDELVALKIHGAEPATIREIQKLGFGPLDADRIVTLQIHDVTPEFLRGFQELGFKMTLDEAVAASIHGVTPGFVKKVREHGFNNLSLEQIIKLKQFDILPDGSNQEKRP
jgi:beta-lactamase regulating signal transducer with metallopeptidase domain